MSDFTFQMLLQCNYTGDENNIEKQSIEHLVENNWEPLNLSTDTPGFDVFMFAIMACQHMSFRNNAAKYGLVLSSSEGLMTIIADEYRCIQSLHVDFKGKLKKGSPNDEMVKSIVARMDLCPVSINLKDIRNRETTVLFESD